MRAVEAGAGDGANVCGEGRVKRRNVSTFNRQRSSVPRCAASFGYNGAMAPEAWREIGERLRPILRRRGIRRAIVFGSLARGEATRRSDLDLILVWETERRFLDRYDELLAEIARAVPERDVDALIYTPEELARLSGRPFIATALREGKTIYEPDEEPA